ncbi:MAG: PQQ-dependent sugar dehydrogenase [Candidatus Binatia bacterium]|nr:PQQ-dependent sugar dehydrogenase [Candidatus Binatia bacterium]
MRSTLIYRLGAMTAAYSFLLITPTVTRAQDITYTTFATGLSQITDIAHAGDSRLFVTQQSGQIRIVQSNGSVNGILFLDLSALVSSGFERGLLGLAFHPNYAVNGYFYVNYTNLGGNTVVARYTVSVDPDIADAGSASTTLTQNQTFSNHNGGDLNFGPTDGYLYIGFGDGGSGCDPNDDAQDPTTFLGKMLRIDVDGGSPYAIPPSNPFVGVGGVLDEIWAQGLRNPWRFAFDRQAPHDMWIGDVGQNAREEIDVQPGGSSGGENYGWDCMEGFQNSSISSCTTTATCPATNDTDPVHDYDRSGGRCSVTGGYIYRGSAHPGFVGEYFFADWCTGDMYSLRDNGGGYTHTTYTTNVPGNPRTFGEDQDGELYLANGNTIFRLDDPTPPVTGCPTSPDPTCNLPGKSVLSIRDTPPSGTSIKDKVVWKSVRGPAEAQAGFGTPTGNTNYLWCLYAGPSSSLIAEAGVAGGAGWQTTGSTGYKFGDSSGAQDGATRILLRGDAALPRTRVQWKGKGNNLQLPSLPLSQTDDVSVRVHNSANANCWGANFAPSTTVRNDAKVFKAKTP